MEARKLKNSWPAVFAAGLLALFVLSFFAGPHSQPDDDWTTSYLVAGSLGEQVMNPHMEPALFQTLKLLAHAVPWLNVYEAFRISMVMGAFAAIAVCMFHMIQPTAALFLSALFVFVYWNDTMVRYNYTFSVGLCAGAAVLLLYCYGSGRMKRAAVVFGGAFWLTAFGWRREAALLLVPYGALLLFAPFLQAAWEKRKLRPERGRVYALACIAVLNVGLVLYSGAFWSQPEWKEYQKFNRARVTLVDYSVAPWEEAKEELEPLGITANDYWCAQNWILADPEVFSLERLEAMAAQKITADQGGNFFEQAAEYFIRAPLRVRACSAFLLAAILVFVTGGVWQWLTVLCAAGGSCLISLYFLWQGRLIDRVEAVIWLGALCVAATQVRPFARRGKRIIGTACGITGMLLLAMVGWRMLPLEGPNGLLRAEFEVTEPVALATMKSGDYYLWDVTQEDMVWIRAYGNLHLPDPEFYRCNGGLGGWTEGSPGLKALRQELGLENPIRALIENEKVYMVNAYSPIGVLHLIQEHYEPQAGLSAAQQLDGNTWALKFTPPFSGGEERPTEWSMESLTPVRTEKAENWYVVRGSAAELKTAEQLWLRIENAMGESRCYRLIARQDGSFDTGLYLDWADPDQGLSYTLLWREEGKMFESAD